MIKRDSDAETEISLFKIAGPLFLRISKDSDEWSASSDGDVFSLWVIHKQRYFEKCLYLHWQSLHVALQGEIQEYLMPVYEEMTKMSRARLLWLSRAVQFVFGEIISLYRENWFDTSMSHRLLHMYIIITYGFLSSFSEKRKTDFLEYFINGILKRGLRIHLNYSENHHLCAGLNRLFSPWLMEWFIIYFGIFLLMMLSENFFFVILLTTP